MYHVKMAFALIQVGTNLWVNPMQVEGVSVVQQPSITPQCASLIIANGSYCSDWTIEQVREALKPAAVAKAMEGK